jgi:hypothetical protein
MQSYNTTFTATVKDAYKAERLRAFWRGVLPPLVSDTVVRTISFSICQRPKYTVMVSAPDVLLQLYRLTKLHEQLAGKILQEDWGCLLLRLTLNRYQFEVNTMLLST